MPKLEAAFKDEIAKALKEGFAPEEIAERRRRLAAGGSFQPRQDNELAGHAERIIYS